MSHCFTVWHGSWVSHLWYMSYLYHISLSCVIGHPMCHKRPLMNGFQLCREGFKKCFLGFRQTDLMSADGKNMILVANCWKITNPGLYWTSARQSMIKLIIFEEIMCKKCWFSANSAKPFCLRRAHLPQCHICYLWERTFTVILHIRHACRKLWKKTKRLNSMAAIQSRKR
jgi:hypothetical protein